MNRRIRDVFELGRVTLLALLAALLVAGSCGGLGDPVAESQSPAETAADDEIGEVQQASRCSAMCAHGNHAPKKECVNACNCAIKCAKKSKKKRKKCYKKHNKQYKCCSLLAC